MNTRITVEEKQTALGPQTAFTLCMTLSPCEWAALEGKLPRVYHDLRMTLEVKRGWPTTEVVLSGATVQGLEATAGTLRSLADDIREQLDAHRETIYLVDRVAEQLHVFLADRVDDLLRSLELDVRDWVGGLDVRLNALENK